MTEGRLPRWQETGFKVAKIRMIVSDAVFALVPPIAIPELMYIKLLMTEPFAAWRTTIIASLKKNGPSPGEI